MSKRQLIMTAIRTVLETAFDGVEVGYWRDAKPQGRTPLITFRDTGATHSRANREHEHNVRVEIDAYVFGDDLGTAMNERLEALIQAIGTNPSFGVPTAHAELEASGLDTLGDGYEVGIVTLVLTVTYRTAAWAGT